MLARPRWTDLVAASALTLGTQVEAWSGVVVGAPRWAMAACYAVGTSVLVFHRTAPILTLTISLTALAVVPGALGVDPASGLTWLIAGLAVVASAGYHARRPLQALGVALGLLALSVVLQKGFVVSDIAYAWLLAGGGWLAGRATASRSLAATLADERAAAAEAAAEYRAAEAVAEERLRIARELHDVVSHGVSVMVLHVGGVRRLLLPQQAEERRALETVERAGREALSEMHRMLGVLRTPAAPGAGPVAGLERVEELLEPVRAAGVDACLQISGQRRPLPAGVDLAAYRIVQEAITNAVRHASPSRLTCTLEYRDDELEMLVRDDGKAKPIPHRSSGHGLVGMRERAELYGGHVESGQHPAGGFHVRAVLPLSAAPVSSAHRETA